MIEPVDINLELINEKVKFKGVSKDRKDQSITFDYLPPIGDGEGFLGLEMLVMSFAGCVSTAIVAILRKMGKNVSGYKMHILGTKHEAPLSLEEIQFEIIINSDNCTDEDVKLSIFKAEQISPVWIALKNNVLVDYKYKIVN